MTLEEIKEAMRKLGTVMTHMEFKNIIKELDTDGDKMLDLREVYKLALIITKFEVSSWIVPFVTVFIVP